MPIGEWVITWKAWLKDVHSPKDLLIRVIVVVAVIAWIALAAIGDLATGAQDCSPTTRPDAYDCEPVDYP